MSLRPSPESVLRIAELRWILVARASHAVGSSALLTVLGYQVYQLTRDPFALGMLGLVAGLPALTLGLFGGHTADRRDRRSIIAVTSGALALAVLALAFISRDTHATSLVGILAIVFLTGVASGFERPAMTAFEAQVIPLDRAAQGASWVSTMWTVGGLMGPALGGLSVAIVGIPATYLLVAAVLALSPLAILQVSRKPVPEAEHGESMLTSVGDGLRFVFKRQQLWGAMSLDLFAVLFGGVEALLPLFAADILGVGPFGLGLMRTAPALGALGVLLVATRRPPHAHAGPLLLGSVAGFGIAIIVFGLSTSFPLSMLALFALGATDAVSMIIRTVTVRIYSPEQMRGRIASVSYLFIGASNELGAFESGLAARFLGAVPAVLLGGVITLFVTGLVAVFAPDLRRLDLRDATLEAEELAALEEWAAPGQTG
jgi:MFS family permease